MFKKLLLGFLLGICLVSFTEAGIAQDSEAGESEDPDNGAGESQEKEYIVDRYYMEYHRRGCKWALRTKPENKIIFHSVAEARAAGRIPCEECRPPIKD